MREETLHICVFEDDQFGSLQPLVHLRPVYNLTCGIRTLREKLTGSFPDASVILHVRDYLLEVTKREHPDYSVNRVPSDARTVLFLNGRVVAHGDFGERFEYDGKDCVYMSGRTPVAAWLSGENLKKIGDRFKSNVLSFSDFSHLENRTADVPLVTYPWDLVNRNGEQIVADFDVLTSGSPQSQGELSESAHLLNPDHIHISRGAKIGPGVVLDAENGPIYVGNNSRILPNSVIEGPVSMGDDSLIKVGAKIYENTTIGKVCKVGGEVEESIIDSYSNKQHDGFIGHAYLGSWVNIGAGTNNSDLKNNYGPVKVFVNGKLTDTGSMFVGLFMGDHSKSGINQMFNTGTVVGVCCNVFGPGQPPKFVPSFSWGTTDGVFTTYKMDRAFEVAGKVMARRDVEFTELDENLFRTVFDLTAEERKIANIGE
ncbi:MAG: GlmU family protein [Fidelibacterota bacterium]